MSIKSELNVLSEIEKIMYNCLEKYTPDTPHSHQRGFIAESAQKKARR